MLNYIIQRYSQSPLVSSLCDAVAGNNNVSVEGLWGSSGSVITAAVAERMTAERKQMILVSPDENHYSFLVDEFQELIKYLDIPDSRLVFFPEDDRLPYDEKSRGMNIVNLRQECLETIAAGRPAIVITTIRALYERLPNPERMQSYKIELTLNKSFDFRYLSELLSVNGYERQDMVDQVGTFAVRGGIVDIYPYGQENPVRIEFDGDEVISIREFDIMSQRSVASRDQLAIYPKLLNEQADSGNDAALSDHAQPSAVYFLFEPDLIESNGAAYHETIEEQYHSARKSDPSVRRPDVEYFGHHEVMRRLAERLQVHFCRISQRRHETVAFRTSRTEEMNGHIGMLREKMATLKSNHWDNLILCNNEGQAQRLDELLDCDDLRSGEDYRIGVGELQEGFYDPYEKIAVFTDHQIFGRIRRPKAVRRFKSVQALRHLKSLKPGDIVVHVDHGIARYAGLEKIVSGEHSAECLKLLYQGGDKLFVPLEHFARVQKFSGEEGVEPKLNRLGTADWERLKSRTQKSIKDIAQDLIKLYAERKASFGTAFSSDTPMQLAMESSFEFEDTPDQEKVTAEIKRDMESDVPMDRLVCGDVGYGKTEVAVRVAFKAAQDSKQAAVLVPTTILAEQHFMTFSRRLKEFPVTVEVISRFKSKKEQDAILKKLADGKIDILIGTHRLLSKDVQFKDLGLLIIDEEQRFGVTHKEKLKKMKAAVDTLTLTATPIPRTLHFSLMGGRDLSTINTPPHDRLPIRTEITRFEEDRIRDAVMREIHRGGQVYYVHNRVQSIEAVTLTLKEVAPKARYGIIHGQMSPQKVEDVIHRFLQKDFDVLVATTIIENGIDIPNVNTIIIDQAHQYGLAQLYQLRGRVGRSSHQAYCYLLTPAFSLLPADAVRRLQAIEEFTDLGSGFVLAMRDLEIRGAGNIFGAEQSGFINTIGFELYCQILDETIAELKNEQGIEQKPGIIATPKKELNIAVKSHLDTLIPEEYINATSERIALYQRLAAVTSLSALTDIEQEMTDRFGKPPQETIHLFDTLRIRVLGEAFGADQITVGPDQWTIEYHQKFLQIHDNALRLQNIIDASLSVSGNVRLKQSKDQFAVLFGFPWFDIQKNVPVKTVPRRDKEIGALITQTLDKLAARLHIAGDIQL